MVIEQGGENYGVVLRQSYPPALSCSLHTQKPLTLFRFVIMLRRKDFFGDKYLCLFYGIHINPAYKHVTIKTRLTTSCFFKEK